MLSQSVFPYTDVLRRPLPAADGSVDVVVLHKLVSNLQVAHSDAGDGNGADKTDEKEGLFWLFKLRWWQDDATKRTVWRKFGVIAKECGRVLKPGGFVLMVGLNETWTTILTAEQHGSIDDGSGAGREGSVDGNIRNLPYQPPYDPEQFLVVECGLGPCADRQLAAQFRAVGCDWPWLAYTMLEKIG
eukprot:gnl/TRDRNA2_/TRDRNA2_169431_c0_seq1.p1 gnl/TRDRNA2_/TRDRNA2_169431_c0~~gnl/TRDRNA2_/TRDRNA2_169431_c0_seq1.p1  ORF type:complete len:187 (+),score=25.07 gnl/TRDRNA2_/TRDRNA2_169431_c0_seq1:73-633(+)